MVLKVCLKILLIVQIIAIEVLVKFILADQPFSKALQSLETCVLVNNNLNGKLFSSLEAQATIDESFKVTSERFFIPNFNL